MSRTLLRAAVAGAALAALPILSACAAGPHAQTTEQFNHVDGTNRDLGSLQIRNVYAEVGASGQVTKGGNLQVVGYIYDRSGESDALLSVTSPLATDTRFTVKGQPATRIPIPALTAVEITGKRGVAKIELIGLTKSLVVGQTLQVTLQFERAGQVTFGIPVEALEEEYGPLPSPPATIKPAQPGPDVTSVPLYRETKAP